MRLHLTMRIALSAAMFATLALARPNPEADAGYSYNAPPMGVRPNHQPPWWSGPSGPSRTRASEVTVERVPLRLIQESHRAPKGPPPPNRGAYFFPSAPARLQQHPPQFVRGHHAAQEQLRLGPQEQRRGAYVFPASARGDLDAPRHNYQQNNYNNGNYNRFNEQRAFPYYNNNNQPQYDRQQYARNLNHPQTGYNTIAYSYDPSYQQQQQQQRSQAPVNYYHNPTPIRVQEQRPQFNNYNPHAQQQNSAPNQQYSAPNQQQQQQQQQVTPTPTTGFPATSPAALQQATAPMGYNYSPPPASTTETPEETTMIVTTTEMAPSNTTEFNAPRITIAISKSTVIHTGKGSYKLDEKTGKPVPLIAEAHSYAGLPEPSTKRPPAKDHLTGEGTGNIPIIARGTPPEDEEDPNEVSSTEGSTEEAPTTSPPEEDTSGEAATPAPQPHVPLFSSWPVKTYGARHAHVIIAPGQTQYFAIGSSAPVKPQLYAPALEPTQYLAPSQYVLPTAAGGNLYYQAQPLTYAHQYGAYHPSVLAKSSPYHYPLLQYISPAYSPLGSVLRYGHEACKTAVEEGTAPEAPEAPEERTPEQDEQQEQPAATLDRRVVYRGGVAVAGPGGTAEAGHGGTAIVGPGGKAYSSPNGVSIVGPGGKVLLKGASTETVLAKGPIIYFHKA